MSFWFRSVSYSWQLWNYYFSWNKGGYVMFSGHSVFVRKVIKNWTVFAKILWRFSTQPKEEWVLIWIRLWMLVCHALQYSSSVESFVLARWQHHFWQRFEHSWLLMFIRYRSEASRCMYVRCVSICWQQVDPCSYCRIFGEALDGDMLSKIIEMLKNFYIRFVICFECLHFVICYCVLTCLLVSRITQHVTGGFGWYFQGRLEFAILKRYKI